MVEKIVYCTFSGIAVVLALMTAMLWNKPYVLMLASGCFLVALLEWFSPMDSLALWVVRRILHE